MSNIALIGVNKDRSLLYSNINELGIKVIGKDTLDKLLGEVDILICENIWQEIDTNISLAEYLYSYYGDKIYNKVIALLNIQYNEKLKDAKVLFYDDNGNEIYLSLDSLNQSILSDEYKAQSRLALKGLIDFIVLSKRVLIDGGHRVNTNSVYTRNLKNKYWSKYECRYSYMAGSTLHNVVQQYLCLDNSDKIDMFKIKSSINTLTNKHTVINLIGFNNAERYSLGMNLRDYINYIENGGNIVKDYKYKDLTQEQLLSYAYSSEFHNKLLRFNSKTTNKYKYLNEVLNMLLELQRYRENIYLYRIDRDVVSIIVYDRGKIQDDLKELSKLIDKSLKGIYSKVLISNIREIENGSIYNYYRINAIDVDKIKNIDNREYNTILDICGSIKYSGK